MHSCPSRVLGIGSVSLIVLLLAAPAMAQSQSPLQPGGWAFHTKIVNILPDGKTEKEVSDSRSERCLTAEFVASDPYLLAERDNKTVDDLSCVASNYNRSGNSANWSFTCTSSKGFTIRSAVRNSLTATTIHNELESRVRRKDGVEFTQLSNTDAVYKGSCGPDMVQF
jgi:hypothetical protein